MGEQNVWAVFLGGKIRQGALVEDHELVFVVAPDEIAARKQAKLKWAAEEVHCRWHAMFTRNRWVSDSS